MYINDVYKHTDLDNHASNHNNGMKPILGYKLIYEQTILQHKKYNFLPVMFRVLVNNDYAWNDTHCEILEVLLESVVFYIY